MDVSHFTIAVLLYQYLQVVLTVFNIYILCTSLSFAYAASSLMSVVLQGVIKVEGGGGGSISAVLIPWGCILSAESEVSHFIR